MSKRPVHITVTCDDRYVEHAAAMLVSVVDVTPEVIVHLLHPEGMDPALWEPIRHVLEGAGGALRPVEVPGSWIRDLDDRRFSTTAWYRTLIPELCPDLERVIHLDADLSVHTSLDELWKTDLGGLPFAAVENPLYPWMPAAADRLGLPEGTRYLNSGVLLMDLAMFRREGAVRRLVQYGAAHPENPWPEQDALAALFPDRWLALHPRWNAQATVYDLRVSQLPWSRRDVKAARRRPAVRHFSGPLKPWTGHPDDRAVASYNRCRVKAGYEPVEVGPTLWRQPWFRAVPARLQRRAMRRIVRRMKERV